MLGSFENLNLRYAICIIKVISMYIQVIIFEQEEKIYVRSKWNDLSRTSFVHQGFSSIFRRALTDEFPIVESLSSIFSTILATVIWIYTFKSQFSERQKRRFIFEEPSENGP